MELLIGFFRDDRGGLDASDPKRLGNVVRAHGRLENNLHWVLDYTFAEIILKKGC
ncbi:MAG: hypothetical protein R8K48_10580 [Gallionella sp.]